MSDEEDLNEWSEGLCGQQKGQVEKEDVQQLGAFGPCYQILQREMEKERRWRDTVRKSDRMLLL